MSVTIKKDNATQAAKRPVKMIAMEHEGWKKRKREAGDKFTATNATAEILIKKKMAKKA